MGKVNLGLDHIHLYVKDLDESIDFYKLIGLEFVKETSHGDRSVMMTVSDSHLLFEIQETRNIDNPGLNHLAFKVDDLDSFCRDLKCLGVTVDGPVNNIATGRRLATIRDPHGFLIQLVQK